MDERKLKYLKLLSSRYRNNGAVSTKIINLSATLNLPKITEHFLSDIHGEDENFQHVLKNASGVIKNYIEEIFGNSLMAAEKRNLATLVYYPEEKLEYIKQKPEFYNDEKEWYRIQIFRMLKLCRRVCEKHTKDKIRSVLPSDFSTILEEMIYEDDTRHKQEYYSEIVDSVVALDCSDRFIIAISTVIGHLSIGHLHIIGDIFDRGRGAAKILDMLTSYHAIDIQWGNHDIVWMAAAAGSDACIANVIRIQARYDNLETIEEDYGINLIPLATFALEYYADDPCDAFMPRNSNKSKKDQALIAKMHKAITVIQLKLEEQLIARHADYNMQHRLMLNRIDFELNTIELNGVTHSLLDTYFPTINPADPTKLSKDEREVMDKIAISFKNSSKLQQHTRFFYNKGSMYKIFNGNLLFHGCIPMVSETEFKSANILGRDVGGRAFLDAFDDLARRAYFSKEGSKDKKRGLDAMWYLWCGPDSPLFGKNKAATFERYFLKDKELHIEEKNVYYSLNNSEVAMSTILSEFGLSEGSRIVNGHVPVKAVRGENPIKAGGKMIVIDGGFARAYHQETGIAGYTLIYNSRGLFLAQHNSFLSAKDAIENETDIVSDTIFVEQFNNRRRVKDTDMGAEIKEEINDLKELLNAYNLGLIKED
ncbi:MAG: fructose-1,6-bisphosphatase [Turicibacter sp.]|nr:fructose-1,6-bisphosphatase [Turicibacter sp.]